MLGSLGAALLAVPEALALGAAALGFDADAFRRVAAEPFARDLAFVLVYLAGVSQAVGHGVVLFLNRVPPARFLVSLALMGAIYAAGALLTAAATLAVADLAFGRRLAFAPTVAVIALAHAPRLLGFLTLAPYLGELLDRVLDVWVLTLVLFGLHHGAGLPVHSAALVAALGWAAMRLLWLALGRPVSAVVDAARRAAAGGPLTLDARNFAEALEARAREVAARRDRP
jgi:hypothetical protein